MKNTFLAIDLGAGSGRVMLGELADGILTLREINHFAYEPLITVGQCYWNIDLISREIKKSLSSVADKDLPVESIGITTLRDDFSLMGDDGIPMLPFISGDTKNDASIGDFFTRMSVDKIFGQTGIQPSEKNTLFQLYTLKQIGFEPLKKAKHLLFMPDIFNYLLTGIIQTEFSIASTSQLYNPVKKMWDHDILRTLGIPVAIMPRIAEPGTVIGSISNNVSYETGIARIPVVAVASLNTASALASIPAAGNNWVFINTGSMCRMGFESATPIITKKSQQLNFTNEGGAGHTFHIQKNITGLRLIRECSNAWNKEKYTLEDLMSFASQAKPFTAFIDTDDSSFLNPEDMPKAISEYCRSSGQKLPEKHGEIIRTILEGLAFKFRIISGQIESLSGVKPEAVYLTGEGINNDLLCRLTTECCGIPVSASPDEATAAGNILLQALALGIVKNVTEIRQITRKSFPLIKYEPGEPEKWDNAFTEYLQIVSRV